MTRKKTNVEFIDEVCKLVGDEYTFLEEYQGNKIKIKVRHNCEECDNHEYCVAPSNFIRGKRCPLHKGDRISKTKTITNEDFSKMFYELFENEYILLSEYKGGKKDITVMHNSKICNNHVWNPNAGDMLYKKSGCPACRSIKNGQSRIISKDEFILRLNEKHKGNILLLNEKYTKASDEIGFKCKTCSHEWSTLGTLLIQKRATGCPRCRQSKGEREISIVLDKLNVKYEIQYIFNDCKNIRPLPFDFSVLDKFGNIELLIEYQGEQHYNPYIEHFGHVKNYKKIRRNDNIKKIYCEENNIKLLEIPYWDFNEIENILIENIQKRDDVYRENEESTN